MEDTISCRVTADYDKETEEVVLGDFGFCSGRGYKDTFRRAYEAAGGTLPEGKLYYNSSDNNVVALERNQNFMVKEDGDFATEKAGKVFLSAEAWDDDQKQYVLVIEVQDRFDWRYSLEDRRGTAWNGGGPGEYHLYGKGPRNV